MRRLWRRWKRRREIRGEHYTITIQGAWWRPSRRRSARLALAVAEQNHEELREISTQAIRSMLLFGEVFTEVPDFVPDDWPYPEYPPDPL